MGKSIKTEAEELYAMALHHIVPFDSGLLFVRRVPGGWIYMDIGEDRDPRCATFVPYNEEFMG